MLAKAENDAERTFLIDNFLRSNRTNELANVLKHMVIGDMDSINTTYPKAILELLRNASQDIKSSGSKKTLLAFLKHHILKYKKEQEANHNHETNSTIQTKTSNKESALLERIEGLLVDRNQTNITEENSNEDDPMPFKDPKEKILGIEKKQTFHEKWLNNDHQDNETDANSNEDNQRLFKDPKDKILRKKTKQTLYGDRIEEESESRSEDVLQKGEQKLLRANIVLPDATNVNTHIVDTILNPGQIVYLMIIKTILVISKSL